ncbi:MAG: hypothetical protein ACLTMP_13065 [Eggerthella lenta]
MASTHAHARSAWSGKWAFILAAAASAVGLGNMWRFPYLAAKYGGGTFLLTYLVLVFTFGVSLLLRRRSVARRGSRPSARSSSSARSTPSSASSPRPCRSSSRRTTASSAAG